ncbi:hypothetical protein [uncultured Porphyromonas sp.]|uniref:hypothetical protein n=1 Tax=uncultured Porphyromonas sp. TaxID=159274 RepID=UPI002803EAA8|nr:hypothetical protein [uncultured Porphyromonas sp.]
MKHFIVVLICFLFCGSLLSQETFECLTPTSQIALNTWNNLRHDDYIPNEKTHIKTVRVALHYILPQKDEIDSLRNFEPIRRDGLLNGYEYAEKLVNMANIIWVNNEKMRLMPNNNTSVLEPKVQLQLSGVSYIYDDGEYRRFFKLHPYAKDEGFRNLDPTKGCIDVYVYNTDKVNDSGGVAGGIPAKYLAVRGGWLRYLTDLKRMKANTPTCGLEVHAWTLNHELGHCMSLYHTVVWGESDDCDDTPSVAEITAYADSLGRDDTDCGNSWEPVYDKKTREEITKDAYLTKSNNLMDYGNWAITPQQLGKIHYTLSHSLKDVTISNYEIDKLTISSMKRSDNSFTSKRIDIVPTSQMEIEEGESMILNSSEVSIQGDFSVQKGGYFVVNIEK